MAANDERSDVLAWYWRFVNGEITMQHFINIVINEIKNANVKNLLTSYSLYTQELEYVYNLRNQNCSPRFDIIQLKEEQEEQKKQMNYQYYIKKCQGHYCMYISIPAEHTMYGKDYNEVSDATFSGVDEEDSTRWVFGWDYAYNTMLSIDTIIVYYIISPKTLLNTRIITLLMIQLNRM